MPSPIRRTRSSACGGCGSRIRQHPDVWPLLAYADQISVTAGDLLQVMVSSAAGRFDAELVRLGTPGRAGLEAPVKSAIEGSHRGRLQSIHAGSYVETPPIASMLREGFTVQAWICPTLVQAGVQCIVSQGAAGEVGWSLELSGDCRVQLREWSAQREWIWTRSELRLAAHSWYFVAGVLDRRRATASIVVASASPWAEDLCSIAEAEVAPGVARDDVEASVCIAACRLDRGAPATALFNGKIESPRLFRAALSKRQLGQLQAGADLESVAPEALVGAWDMSVALDSVTVLDRSLAAAHGRCVNMPTRAVTGHLWRGQTLDPEDDPSLYGAIHFHDDDLADAGWSPDLFLPINPELSSGLYAVKLTSEETNAYVPFYVRPARGEPSAPALLIAPTNTYLAYANSRLAAAIDERAGDRDVPLRPIDRFVASHPALGGSLYDTHRDGSGVCYSSRLRPIPNIDPTYVDWQIDGPRHFAADLQLISWLAARGQDVDIATDEDLHREGAELLEPYRVVMTGSHPEYCSGVMLDAISSYLECGGNLMYLGGNGFYWVTSYHRELPHLIEVRKGFSGTRNWQVAPGEEHHSTTGERGGLWRHRGRSSHRLVGVGTVGHAPADGVGYRRLPESYDEKVSFVFEGVAGETFGEFGLALGGAAGDEIDATDPVLGTPAHAVILARSPSPAGYVPMMENELWYRQDRTAEHNPRIRAEIVLFETGHGGAVFSVGSVSWCGALCWNGCDNDVSKITANVMRRFLAGPVS